MSAHELVSEYERTGPIPAATSARSLLLTVLGVFVYEHGGAAWTGSLLDALASFGIGDGNARQAISRASQAGWLTSERHGRRARWRMTEQAEALIGQGAERIYSFGQADIEWDGQWLVVLASVPESKRRLRYRLRVKLSWAGFGSLGPGIWVSPWPDREPEALEVVRSLDTRIEARSFVARHGQIGNEFAIASDAWDLASLAADYRDFIDQFTSVAPASTDDAGPALLRLIHTWRRFPAVDPTLPSELLPPDWPGRRAATIFADRRSHWLQAANRWWLGVEEAHGA